MVNTYDSILCNLFIRQCFVLPCPSAATDIDRFSLSCSFLISIKLLDNSLMLSLNIAKLGKR